MHKRCMRDMHICCKPPHCWEGSSQSVAHHKQHADRPTPGLGAVTSTRYLQQVPLKSLSQGNAGPVNERSTDSEQRATPCWAGGWIHPVLTTHAEAQRVYVQSKASHPPSTVTTCMPSTLYSGARQALTERCHSCPSSLLDTMTVHAPHPPSPQPSLVPVRPSSAQGDL